MGTPGAKEGGKHEGEELAQELFLTAQAPFDLSDQIIGKAQFLKGLMEGFDIALGLSLLALMTFFGIETTASNSFGLFFGVLSGGGHGDILHMRRQ